MVMRATFRNKRKCVTEASHSPRLLYHGNNILIPTDFRYTSEGRGDIVFFHISFLINVARHNHTTLSERARTRTL